MHSVLVRCREAKIPDVVFGDVFDVYVDFSFLQVVGLLEFTTDLAAKR